MHDKKEIRGRPSEIKAVGNPRQESTATIQSHLVVLRHFVVLVFALQAFYSSYSKEKQLR